MYFQMGVQCVSKMVWLLIRTGCLSVCDRLLIRTSHHNNANRISIRYLLSQYPPRQPPNLIFSYLRLVITHRYLTTHLQHCIPDQTLFYHVIISWLLAHSLLLTTTALCKRNKKRKCVRTKFDKALCTLFTYTCSLTFSLSLPPISLPMERIKQQRRWIGIRDVNSNDSLHKHHEDKVGIPSSYLPHISLPKHLVGERY